MQKKKRKVTPLVHKMYYTLHRRNLQGQILRSLSISMMYVFVYGWERDMCLVHSLLSISSGFFFHWVVITVFHNQFIKTAFCIFYVIFLCHYQRNRITSQKIICVPVIALHNQFIISWPLVVVVHFSDYPFTYSSVSWWSMPDINNQRCTNNNDFSSDF